MFNQFLFESINDYDTIIFDGFLFFNDEQNLLIEEAIRKQKNIVFLAKTMKADKSDFLLNSLYLPLEKEFNINLNLVKIANDESESINNAISFVKDNYLDFTASNNVEIDDGFRFIEPFTSRDGELTYIVSRISDYLKKSFNGNREKIIKALSYDIAVVIANNKEKYEHQLNLILKNKGVFFLNYESDLLSEFKFKMFGKLPSRIAAEKDSVEQIEQKYLKFIPTERLIKTNHQIIWFGRYFCKAISPECASCKLKCICKNHSEK